MVELLEKDVYSEARQSSKGNQLKASRDGWWYKADYTGYEGLAEYMVSVLLEKSDLRDGEFVRYATEKLCYGGRTFSGCKSRDFLADGEQLFTLERLFESAYGESLYKAIFRMEGVADRLIFLVEQTEYLTGLTDFGTYMAKLLAVDALFLNEDRHTHNIAVILSGDGSYRLCPLFDHGACLLSDTAVDYPLGGDLYGMIDRVRAKTCSADFDEQLDAAERLYGRQVTFSFTHGDVQTLLDKESHYSEEIKTRVRDIIFDRMRKYAVRELRT